MNTVALPRSGPCGPHVSARQRMGSKFSWTTNAQRKPCRFTVAAASLSSRLVPKLDGDEFRHPLDQQNTAMLRSLPGLELVAKNLLGGPGFEQALYLENIGAAVKVGPNQMRTIHNLLLEACTCLSMEVPALYITQSSSPNAYTLAIADRQPFIMMNTGLLELLDARELQAVIAHELGHLKCDHGVWLTVAHVLAHSTVTMIPVVSDAVQERLFRWIRAAELTCDRSALLVAQDSKVVISALMKLAGGTTAYAHELNIEAFLEQAASYDEATASPLGSYLKNNQNRQLSHPLPVMRAREIERWALTSQYRSLLSKGHVRAQ